MAKPLTVSTHRSERSFTYKSLKNEQCSCVLMLPSMVVADSKPIPRKGKEQSADGALTTSLIKGQGLSGRHCNCVCVCVYVCVCMCVCGTMLAGVRRRPGGLGHGRIVTEVAPVSMSDSSLCCSDEALPEPLLPSLGANGCNLLSDFADTTASAKTRKEIRNIIILSMPVQRQRSGDGIPQPATSMTRSPQSPAACQ